MADSITDLVPYLRTIDENELLQNAYYGTGGFSDGTYLYRHRREDAEQYKFRQMLAYYLNYVQPVINSHVDPVFKDPAQREWKGSGVQLFELYRDNMDGAGTELGDFMKLAGLAAKIFGAVIIITDNAQDQPATVGEVLAEGKIPYSYLVTPNRITDFQVDAKGKLLSISYTEPEIGDDGQRTNEQLIRKWTRNAWALYRDSKMIQGNAHNLGRVPATVLVSRKLQPGNIKPPSEFIAVARTNLHIYQLCSWLAEIHANQTFAVLTYPVIGKPPEDLTIGTNNALAFNGEGRHAPEWKAPPATPAESLQAQIDRLIQEIYRMANLSYVTGTKAASSGISKQWDFEKTNQALSELAQNCEAAEQDLIDVFSGWTGQALDYTVSYPREFALEDLTVELANAQAVLDMAMGTELKVEVARKVLELYFDLEPERFDEILETIRKEAEDAAYAMDEMKRKMAEGDESDPKDDDTDNKDKDPGGNKAGV